jgi:hypothetical protein
MKLHIIATAFNRPLDLKRLVYDIMLQTNGNWTLKIIHDGPPPSGMKTFVTSLKDPRIGFESTKLINGYWGHPNRAAMLSKVDGNPNDYVLITNDDNQYVKSFVEIFLRNCQRSVGMIFCNTIHNYFDYDILVTQCRVGAIDMGSFIVRLDIAQKVGFNHTVEVADGIYAEECFQECTRQGLRVLAIRKALFIHN